MKPLFYCLICMLLCSCSSQPPITVAKNVDLNKFMGDWNIIAYTPAFIDEDAYNGVESYSLNEDGTIDTTYTFNKGGFNGKQKTYNPTGFVVEGTGNAIWKMQFLWPFMSDYRIMYVDQGYQNTIIARQKRDLFWIMSRKKKLEDQQLNSYLELLKSEGYKLDDYRIMPQN